ncbi:MAG TPA: hypothetical protein VEK06_03430 [Myxococcota bacterium]|nr:hypothetical protein [Myxococcota bacterium]
MLFFIVLSAFTFTAQVYGESFTINTFNEIIQERTIIPKKNVSSVVKNRATAILDLEKNGQIVLNPGRRSLLNEMLTYSSQLGTDLPRINEIRIGDVVIPKAWREGKSGELQFALIGKMLYKYIKNTRPEALDNSLPGRIGPFYVAEIIYGISQNFSGPALELAYKLSGLTINEWAAEMGGAITHAASFTLEPMKDPILTVTFTCETEMFNLVDPSKKSLILITQSKLFYDLLNDDVNFGFSYSINYNGAARVLGTLPESMIF